MSVTDAEILTAIETGMLMIPEMPGRVTHLRIPGVRGRVTNVPNPLVNMVGDARLTEENADATIRSVRAAYGGAPFSWLVGPGTTPEDLPDRLRAAGFVSEGAGMAGMVLRDLSAPIEVPPDVTVRPATPEDHAAMVQIGAACFGISEDASQLFGDAMSAPGARPSRAYVAVLEGVEGPVGFGAAVFWPDLPIMELGGAAVLAEHRGRGAYRALLARRLDDARAEGIEAVVIQAARATSAPICARVGMREVCSLNLYLHLPPDGTAPEA